MSDSICANADEDDESGEDEDKDEEEDEEDDEEEGGWAVEVTCADIWSVARCSS